MGQSSMSYDDYRREMSVKGTAYENYIYPIFAKEWSIPEFWVKPFEGRNEQFMLVKTGLG